MKLYGIIYKLTNKINGKSYVGQTTQNIKVRINQHKVKKGNIPISLAIRKYGIDNFKIEVIAECYDKENLDQTEEMIIKNEGSICPCGYNIRSGGNSSKLKESTKRLLSESAKGRKHKKRTIKKCLNTSKALGCKEYKLTLKTNQKRKLSRKKVEGTNLITGETITFESTIDAQMTGGFHRGKISECCNGKRNVHKLHTWKYI